MTRQDELDRMLSAWLDDPTTLPAPDYLGEVLEETRQTRQRPAWSSLERWLPMTLAPRISTWPLPARFVTIGLMLLLALLASLTIVPMLSGTVTSPVPQAATNGKVAFSQGGGIYVVDTPDGEPRLLPAGAQDSFGPAWSPDGRHLGFLKVDGDQFTVMVTDPDGADAVALNPDTPLYDVSAGSWAPDSSALAIASTVDGTPTISIFRADGSGQIPFDRGGPIDMPAWRPFSDPAHPELLYRAVGDPATLMLSGTDTSVGSRTVLTVDDIMGSRTSGFGGTWDFLGPAWAPDGRRFTYHSLVDLGDAAPDGNGWRVHVGRTLGCDPGCGSDEVIEYDPQSDDEYGAVWSPDGSRIAFVALDSSYSHLVIATLGDDDTIIPERTVVTHGIVTPEPNTMGYAWAPDGSALVLIDTGWSQAYLVDAASGEMELLPWHADEGPTWQAAS